MRGRERSGLGMNKLGRLAFNPQPLSLQHRSQSAGSRRRCGLRFDPVLNHLGGLAWRWP